MLKTAISLIFLLSSTTVLARNVRQYRLGDEWGKKKVFSKTLKNESEIFQRAAKATAHLPIGGTGFYLGKFDGSHILATNHHVCETASDCVGDRANFKMLGKKFKMTKLLFSIPEIDLALLILEVPDINEDELLSVGKNFSFDKVIQKGTPLLTIGFGSGGNPRNAMMANQDNDCFVFSETGDYVLMPDPDRVNSGNYEAWSFAHGCDISHGDSGSAMVERETGDIIGIAWTGRIPTKKKFRKSSILEEIFKNSDPLIWKELSYSVPASKIKEVLLDKVTHEDEKAFAVVKEILY